MTKKSFKEQYERLEQIVEELSVSEKDIDESIKIFKEGIELYKSCNKLLEDAEKKVVKLTTDGEKEDYEEMS